MRRLRAPRMFLAALMLALPLSGAPARAAAPSAPDSATGVYAAIGCGIGIKAIIGSAGSPGIVIATISMCALMIFDALHSPD